MLNGYPIDNTRFKISKYFSILSKHFQNDQKLLLCKVKKKQNTNEGEIGRVDNDIYRIRDNGLYSYCIMFMLIWLSKQILSTMR